MISLAQFSGTLMFPVGVGTETAGSGVSVLSAAGKIRGADDPMQRLFALAPPVQKMSDEAAASFWIHF